MVSYNENLMGELVIRQKENEFKIDIRQGNCLAVFIHVSKQESGGYLHTLYSFFANTQHLRNIIKHDKKVFYDEVVSISLNLKYKECNTLLKHLTKCGYKVTCYYE